jgi:hypothetical protein
MNEMPAQDERARRLVEIQLDIQRLLEVCTERGTPAVDNATIDRAVKILRTEPQSLTTEQEEELWRLRVLLSRLARPATCTGLRLLSVLEGDARGKGEPTKAIRKYKHWIGYRLILLLLAVALFHGYSILVKKMLERTNQNLLDLGAIFDQLSLKPSNTDKPIDHSALIGKCIEARYTLRQLRFWDFSDLLRRWGPSDSRGTTENKEATENACKLFSSLFTDPTKVAVFVDDVRNQVYNPLVAERAHADLILQIVTIILPMLYGAVGAFVFDVRRIAELVEQGALRGVFRFRYRLRLFLGAIFGLALSTLFDVRSLFALPDTIFEPSLATAFVAGYSIEVVFSVLDLVAVRLKNAVTGTEKRQAHADILSDKT